MSDFGLGQDTFHAEWCRSLFNRLNDGGVWGIPRSGLVFRKLGDTLVLSERMPWSEELSITEAELHAQQDAEFEVVRKNFEAAGIHVVQGGQG